MERKVCINCEEYLAERCDAQQETCDGPEDNLIKKMPTVEELTGFLKGSSGKVAVLFDRNAGEFKMVDRYEETRSPNKI